MNTTTGELNELAQLEAGGNMESTEKDYIEQDINDTRKTRQIAASVADQLIKQEEEAKRRPSRQNFRISKN